MVNPAANAGVAAVSETGSTALSLAQATIKEQIRNGDRGAQEGKAHKLASNRGDMRVAAP